MNETINRIIEGLEEDINFIRFAINRCDITSSDVERLDGEIIGLTYAIEAIKKGFEE